jgi:hypothetical protein
MIVPIMNALSEKKKIDVGDLLDISKMFIEVLSGNESLGVIYKDGTVKIFDSANETYKIIESRSELANSVICDPEYYYKNEIKSEYPEGKYMIFDRSKKLNVIELEPFANRKRSMNCILFLVIFGDKMWSDTKW